MWSYQFAKMLKLTGEHHAVIAEIAEIAEIADS